MQTQLGKTERELKIRDHSAETVKSYLYGLREYFTFRKEKLETLDQDNIRGFLMLCDQKGVSARSRDLFLGAIRFRYRNAAKSNQTIGIASAKKPKGLRIVLSRSGVERIPSSVKNHKHKLLLSLCYGAGLRVSETVALKARDMHSNEMTIHIKSAKGQRDRISALPEKLINDLQSLMAGKSNNDYICASERGGKLTARTAGKILGNAL